GDRPRRAVPQRNAVAGNGLADPAPPRSGSGRLGALHRRPLQGRLRRRRLGRARGPFVRADAGARRARLPDRPGRSPPIPALNPVTERRARPTTRLGRDIGEVAVIGCPEVSGHRLDDEKLETLRSWGAGLSADGRDELRAAGKAILILVEEID